MGLSDIFIGSYLVGSAIGDRRANKRQAEWDAALLDEERRYRSQQEDLARATLNSQLRQEQMIWKGTPEGQSYMRWRPEALKAIYLLTEVQDIWNKAWYDHYMSDPAAKDRRDKIRQKIVITSLVGTILSILMLPVLFSGTIYLVVNLFQLLGLLIGKGYNPTPILKPLEGQVPGIGILAISFLAFSIPLFFTYKWTFKVMDWSEVMHRDACGMVTSEGRPIDPARANPEWPSWDTTATNSGGTAWLLSALTKAAYAFPSYNGKLHRTRFRVVDPKPEFPDGVNEALKQIREKVAASGLKQY